MPIKLPDTCPRGLDDCEPLSQICSDSGECFICCGYNDGKTREEEGDIFRHCWKNEFIDEMSDFEHRDLTDTISVMSQALSVDANMKCSASSKKSVTREAIKNSKTLLKRYVGDD